MAKKMIDGEAPFQVLAHSFGVSPSENGYTLEYSADGYDYTEWEEATPADENLFVINVPKCAYFRLKGNSGEVTVCF